MKNGPRVRAKLAYGFAAQRFWLGARRNEALSQKNQRKSRELFLREPLDGSDAILYDDKASFETRSE